MERKGLWQALQPDRAASVAVKARAPKVQLIGRLPAEAYICILHYLPVPDFPAFALSSWQLAALTRDDRVWRVKLDWLDYRGPEAIQWRNQNRRHSQAPDPPPPPEHLLETPNDGAQRGPAAAADDFGDFFDGDTGDISLRDDADSGDVSLVHDDGFGDFQDFDTVPPARFSVDGFGTSDSPASNPRRQSVGVDLMTLMDEEDEAGLHAPVKSRALASKPKPKPRPVQTLRPSRPGAEVSLRQVFMRHQALLLPYYLSFLTHTTSSLLFSSPTLTPESRSLLLSSLVRFCEPLVAPTRSLPQRQTVRRNVQSAIDFFESALIAEFERADDRGDESAMREKARVLWEVNGTSGNVAQVFVQKREIFYDQTHKPLKNLVKVEAPDGQMVDGIDFSAMNAYMTDVLRVVSREGGLIARVFPLEADVLLYFTERIANDVVSDYITTLLADAQSLQQPLFLLATAATFGQVYRLVNAVLEVEPHNPIVTKERAEDVVFRMFEPHMDDYLQEEGDWIREVLEGMCNEWDQKLASDTAITDATFLASHNPALVKRNVLAGFTKVLLLPVTIIPKTASIGLNALTTGATGAFNTFASLGGQLAGAGPSSRSRTPGPGEEAHDVTAVDVADWSNNPPRASIDGGGVVSFTHSKSSAIPHASRTSLSSSAPTTPQDSRASDQFDRLQLLLSLDTALQLIQADRDCLKRVQTFNRYPGTYGRKVRDAMEEIFIILLQTLGEKHVAPGFAKATSQMNNYKPEEHEKGTSVAPLVQFFELVHIGDTIQQMVEVYFEKEMAAYIDKKDFLNTVVREKKRFETALDDAVAQGLNAGVNVLMTQVEHVVARQQGVSDFCPAPGTDMDLQPTAACRAAIEVLEKHCAMLKGSTDKQILEVFHSEVGIRLHAILLKHLKRIVVSIDGGFQLISDLNAYHAFISSLRQPQVTAYFSSLKMVGELFIVDSPKELGLLVRDVTRYDGTLSTDDLYELVQQRADWKRIEREVERGLFGFKKEDCVLQ